MRNPDERISDIFLAIDRCLGYREHLESSDAGIANMAFDAVLRNLAVIGEAVRSLPDEFRDRVPDVPWASIAGLRNIVVHEYFRVDPDLVIDIVDNQLVALRRALQPHH